MIDERINAKDDGKGWDECCGCVGGDEYFPLLPFNILIRSCKSLPLPVSTVTEIGEILSSSSSECVKSIVDTWMDGT